MNRLNIFLFAFFLTTLFGYRALAKSVEYDPPKKNVESLVDTLNTVIQDLCWSPDSRSIYFSAMRVKPDYSNYSPGLWTVYRYDHLTGSVSLIIRSALNVAVSPSGERLAVSKNDGQNRDVYIYDIDGSNPVPLITGAHKISAPVWSPDGRRIAYVNTIGGTEEIFIINQDGAHNVQLTHSEGHKAYNPSWSPDGRFIAYYLEKGDGRDQIHVIRADGTRDRNITRDTFNNIFPGWIDSNTIIYGQGRKNGPTKLFQIDRNGKNKRPVMQIESFYGRYSPDGEKIGYVNDEQGTIEILSKEGATIDTIVLPDD